MLETAATKMPPTLCLVKGADGEHKYGQYVVKEKEKLLWRKGIKTGVEVPWGQWGDHYR